jgi:undecaprenyl-diphosphatase
MSYLPDLIRRFHPIRQVSANMPQLLKVAAEFLPLIALMAAAAIAAGFIELASDVREGDAHRVDRAILLALRTPNNPTEPIGPAWLQTIMLDLTALGGSPVLTLVTIIATGYFLAARKTAAALYLSTAVISGALLSNTLKIGFARPRPELVAHLVQVQNPSFPSGHAMNSAVTFLTIGVLLARAESGWRLKLYLITVAMALTFIVGCSRVYLGVHWPTDVLAGWSVGAAWALLCWSFALWLQRRRALEPS